MTVIIKLQGGLGNQMFQYAIGKNLEQRNNTDFKLDVTAFKDDPQREYALGCFNVVQKFATQKEISNFLKYRTRKGRIWFWYNRLIADKTRYVQERQFNFDPMIFTLKKPVYLDGYWQTERYFKEIEGVIRKDFTLKNKPSFETENWIEKVAKYNSISIHIRRGDYVHNPKTNQFHGVCSSEYYNDAINLISQKIDEPVFFIFSDDVDWVKENFKIGHPVFYVSNKMIPDYEELHIMSKCKNNIIANSSFSWWGAWLNENPRKIVIAPKKWFVTKKMNTVDLIPENWQTI